MGQIDEKTVAALVSEQVSKICDQGLVEQIKKLLVVPYVVERNWNYGEKDQKYDCWTVLEHPPTNTGIAYCASGFGPTFPWGLVFLAGRHTSIGMDDGWFATLEDAFRESQAFDGQNPPGYEVA